MRVEDTLFILFIFLIPATTASYAYIRITKIRKIYFPVLLIIGLAITFIGGFIMFLINFGAIHTGGTAIQLVPDVIAKNPNLVIRLYGTLIFLCILNTSVLTVLYVMIAKGIMKGKGEG